MKIQTFPLRGVSRLAALSMFAAVCVYMYLGIFSRYLSDDYCEAVYVTVDSPFEAVLNRYMNGEWRAANRYSNLLFVGFSEWLGPYNLQVTTPLMILLWAIGLVWLVHEARKLAGLSWLIEIDMFLGASLAFFTLLQAPQLFQTMYWRSSMFTHFAPLVFGSFLLAFLLRMIGRALHESVPFRVHVIILPASFVIAGFSEPPVAVMVTGLGLAILAVWVCMSGPARARVLPLLGTAFTGAFLGLVVMALSPANFNMMNEERPGLIELLRDSFSFPFIFIQGTFKLLPLPSLISMLIPALLVWCWRMTSPESRVDRKKLIWLAAIAPLLMYLFIAASFSPSVYGQGFPIERMRFAARCFLTICLMFEGGLLGWVLWDLFPASSTLRYVLLGSFALIAVVYPLRAAIRLLPEILEYQERARMWDLRDAYITRHAASGETDLIVPGFSGVSSVKELDDDRNHWVNLCAARYYGVNSIRAVSIPDEYVLEYLDD